MIEPGLTEVDVLLALGVDGERSNGNVGNVSIEFIEHARKDVTGMLLLFAVLIGHQRDGAVGMGQMQCEYKARVDRRVGL